MCNEANSYKSIDISKYYNRKIKSIKLNYNTRFGFLNFDGSGVETFVTYPAGTLVEILGLVYEGVCEFDGDDLYNTVVKINGDYFYHVGAYDYYDDSVDVIN